MRIDNAVPPKLVLRNKMQKCCHRCYMERSVTINHPTLKRLREAKVEATGLAGGEETSLARTEYPGI